MVHCLIFDLDFRGVNLIYNGWHGFRPGFPPWFPADPACHGQTALQQWGTSQPLTNRGRNCGWRAGDIGHGASFTGAAPRRVPPSGGARP